MKIEANNTTIKEYLGGTNKVYNIPEFQRIYSWGTQQLEDLWSDLSTSENGEHFIGSIISYDEQGNLKSITDGQQRLTTIIILLSCIRNHFENLSKPSADGTHNYLISMDDDNQQSFKIKSSNSSNETQTYFKDLLKRNDEDKYYDHTSIKPSSVSTEAENLFNAKKYFDKELENLLKEINSDTEKIEKLKDIRNRVFNLNTVSINLENSKDAYTIFSTLNSRGMDLSVLDLIKNHLLKLIPNTETDNSL